jgi:predicted NUDIX family NTP pyrophosphohydrolase
VHGERGTRTVTKHSAGLLLCRRRSDRIEVLLVHPGGPWWSTKDAGSWSIPKGEYGAGEDPRTTAIREFHEELGQPPPMEQMLSLGEVRQPGGKRVVAWAVSGDLDVSAVTSNTFELEWPRGSGVVRTYPEIDRAGWFEPAEARRKLLRGQLPFLDRVAELVGELVDEPRTAGPPSGRRAVASPDV